MDTNYWIYWFDERLPEHDSVDDVMQRTIQNDVVVSTVTLMEVAHYFKMIPPDILNEKMRMIADLSTLSLVDFTSTIIQSSVNLRSHGTWFERLCNSCHNEVGRIQDPPHP